jgi:copper chaperone NosL
MTRLLRSVAFLFVAALLAACGSATDEPQPPEIVYGQDLCEACGMIIGEARFAAASLTADGQAHKFDDIGDMLAYHQQHPEAEVRAWFVHDYPTQTWLRGETAFYVRSAEIDSPMGHGLAAFAEQAAAEAFAAERGAEVLTFAALRETATMAHGH